LDPRNNDVWVNLARSYRGARRFAEAHAMFDHALSIAPGSAAVIAEKSEAYRAAGDLDSSERLLGPVPPEPDSELFDDYVTTFILRRDFARALEIYSNALTKKQPELEVFYTRLDIAYLHQLTGRSEEAKPVFEEGRRKVEELLAAGDQSLWLYGERLALAAALGDRATVERESEALLRRTEKDRWRLPQSEHVVARAFATLGDAERAIPHIERALSMPAQYGLTQAYLRLDARWDRIRNDPRFQKLAETKP
ncbi:MAG: tetratricopeptide repeat protein, partial [Verrucomicrobiota bacterium]|nr:tetratricopeptide repeat protein [Verrucomicrobiota bacterium]